MEWIYYRKMYDMIPQPWILVCLKMFKISKQVIDFITRTMKKKLKNRSRNWRTASSRSENIKRRHLQKRLIDLTTIHLTTIHLTTIHFTHDIAKPNIKKRQRRVKNL